MPRTDNQILASLLEDCASTLVVLEELERKAQRHGFKRDSLRLAKQNVAVLKSQAMEAMKK